MNQTAMRNKELQIEQEKLKLEQDIAKKGRAKDVALGVVGAAAKIAAAAIPGGKAAKAGAAAAKGAAAAAAAGKGARTGFRNDPKFYMKVVGTTSVSASVPTYFRQGQPGAYPGTNMFGDSRIAVINYVNTIGNETNTDGNGSTSDVQFALSYYYSQTLQNNSRVPKEEPPEFGMYTFSWVDVAHAIEVMKKAIAVSTKYVDQNAAYGKQLVEAIGFDYDDLVANRANYISLLNMMIAEFNINAAIPKSMAYFDRKMYLAKAILRDTKSDIGSLAIYRQTYYWKFDTAKNTCTAVTFGAYGGTPVKMSDWMKTVRGLITELKDSLVCNNIKANILSAIPVSNLITLEPLVDASKIVDTYFVDSDYEREQLANIATLPDEFTFVQGSLDLYVTTEGYLIQGASDSDIGVQLRSPTGISASADVFCQVINRVQQMLNFYHDSITAEDVIEASRFKYLLRSATGGSLKIASSGTEVVTNISVLNGVPRTGNVPTRGKDYYQVRTIVTPKMSTSVNAMNGDLSMRVNDYYGFTTLSGFDWCPLVLIMPNLLYYSTTDTKWYYSGAETINGKPTDTYLLLGDIGKVVSYPEENIKVNNSQANKSLFMVDREVFKQGF